MQSSGDLPSEASSPSQLLAGNSRPETAGDDDQSTTLPSSDTTLPPIRASLASSPPEKLTKLPYLASKDVYQAGDLERHHRRLYNDGLQSQADASLHDGDGARLMERQMREYNQRRSIETKPRRPSFLDNILPQRTPLLLDRKAEGKPRRPSFLDNILPQRAPRSNLLDRRVIQNLGVESRRMPQDHGEHTVNDDPKSISATPLMSNASSSPSENLTSKLGDTTAGTKRSVEFAVPTDRSVNRVSKRKRHDLERDTTPRRRDNLTRKEDTEAHSSEVDCPVYKYHILHNLPPPCRGCRVSVMSQVRSHLSPSRSSCSHRGYPLFVEQCSRCKQDFVDRHVYDLHKAANACPFQRQIRGDIVVPWARQYLALYPSARRIPLPWPDVRGWLPESVLNQCREPPITRQAASPTADGPEGLTDSSLYNHAMSHHIPQPSHDSIQPPNFPSLGVSDHKMVNGLVPENPSTTRQGSDANSSYWTSILRSLETHQRTIRQNAAYLNKEQLEYLATESQRVFNISQGMYRLRQDQPLRGTLRDETQVNGGSSHVNPGHTSHISPHMVPRQLQYQTMDQGLSSEASRLSPIQAMEPIHHFHNVGKSLPSAAPLHSSAKARDMSVTMHLFSDSGYKSGIATDTQSVTSEVSAGSSLGVSRDFIDDFIALFTDTLIKKAGARQWAQFAMAHNSPVEIEKRLTALLKAFTIHLASRSSPITLTQSTHHCAQDDPSTRNLLDGAIKLIRTYRPMIARYFLDHSVGSRSSETSLSDHLQGLGRHFSLAEKVDLLARQGGYEVDEEDEDNFIDENIVAQLEPVQAMLVAGDAFGHLASELRRSLYRDNLYQMVAIRNVVFESNISDDTGCWNTVGLLAKWNVMEFLLSQYRKMPPVASIVVLTGSTLYAQATTCGEYVRTNWPITGVILLDLLDKALSSDVEKTATMEFELQDCTPRISIHIGDDYIRLSAGTVTKRVVVELAQLLAWIGSAFSNSPFGEDLAYGIPSVTRTQNGDSPTDSESHDTASFNITFEHEPVHATEAACWVPLFNGMTIVAGFPIPTRGEEMGLEISLKLLAAIAGVSHVTNFEGGLLMKGFCNLIVPIQKTDDRIQWHVVMNQDSDTYLSYDDGLSRCKSRLSIEEFGFDDLELTRAFLGWCSIYTSRLGSKAIDYDNIDYSGAGEASSLFHLNGAQVGFQQWATATANFSIGAKQTKHYIERDGPFRNIVSAAERTPVLLYDTQQRRGYLVSATHVILHMIQHRHRQDPFEVNNQRIVLETCVPPGSTAKEILKKNQDLCLSDDGRYTFKNVVHNIWSILEDLRAKTVTKNQNAQGIAIEKPFSHYVHGYEFRAVVEERGDYTLMEKELSRHHGGWLLLVRDINALVLLADGFGDLILPSDENRSQICNIWQRVPSGHDYLATTCDMLTDLYDVAGSRVSRKHLTTTHLQWHQGHSQLFDACGNTRACKCNRLQQIVSKAETVVRPNIGDVTTGAVIFGNCDSLLGSLASSLRSKVAPKPPFYQHANAGLVPIKDCTLDETVSLGTSTRCGSNTTTLISTPIVAPCTIRTVLDPLPKETAREMIHRPMSLSKKRVLSPEQAFAEFEQDQQDYERTEILPALKRKQGFRVGSAT